MSKDNVNNYLKTALQDINKKRLYINNLNSLPKLTAKGFSDFYSEIPTNVTFEYNRQKIHLDSQKFYLSLYEESINFETPPIDRRTALIGNQLLITADFSLSGGLETEIFLIFYNEEEKIKASILPCSNQSMQKVIDCPDNAVSYRIAIRLKGTGDFQINSLTVEQKVQSGSQPGLYAGSQSGRKVLKNEQISNFKTSINQLDYHRNGQEKDVKIASILDEFSHECFKYDCELLPIKKATWKEELESFQPDFLFVESCWRGNGKEWMYEVANLHINAHRTALKELTDYCEENGITTVFWDKEGVENFDFFREAGSYFDYIFTADENNIDKYREATGNENVYVLAFAAQPQVHNPIYKNKNALGDVAFAGSYYNNKHDLRKRDIENIIGESLQFGTHIFDRYHGRPPAEYPNNQWPAEYQKNIVGSLGYKEMLEAYKNYKIFLNVNSVQDSKYMFARRVFELLASRTMVVSGPSIGVEETFGELVPVVHSKEETKQVLRTYLNNETVRQRLEKEGFRYVHEQHTYKNRLQEIYNIIGIEKDIITQPEVTIVVATQRNEFLDNIYQSIQHQTYQNFNVVIALNKDDMDVKAWKNKFRNLGKQLKILQIDESESLGNCLNAAIEKSDGEVIAKFDDDDYYAPNYLRDMLLSMNYSNSDIVGKSSHYVYLESQNLLVVKTMGSEEESYSDFVSGATLVFKRSLFDSLGGFADRSRGEDTDLLKRAKEAGYLIYSNDKFNFCLFRRKNTSSHTWHVDDSEILRNSVSHSYTSDYKTPISF